MAKKSTQKLPATRENIKKLEEEIRIVKVNLKEMNKEVNSKITSSRTRVLIEMDDFRNEINDKMTLLRDDVTAMKDEIVTELKAMREEDAAHQGSHDRQQATLDDHEQRITSLEQI